MNARRASRGLSVATLLLVLAPGPALPDPRVEPLESGLVERAERRLAVLDVSFVPRKGAAGPVPRLGPEDFDLVVGGETMTIDYADRVCDVPGDAIVERAGEPVDPRRPVDTPAPRPPARATYIFYLEHKLLSMTGQVHALEMTEQLIRELVHDGNRGSIVSSGREVVQSELTDNPDELLAALRDIARDVAQTGESVYAQTEESRYEEILSQIDPDIQIAIARAYQLEEQRVTGNRLRRLAASLGALSEVDAPKALFYFADAVRSRPGEHYIEPFMTVDPFGSLTEGSSMHHTFGYEEVLGQANAQGVRLYTVQAQGVAPIPRIRLDPDRPDLRFTQAEQTMRSIAAETGGAMFFGGPGAATRVADVVRQDLGCLYLLSFRPNPLPQDRPLPVLVRLRETDRTRGLSRLFDLHTRGQMVIQSPSKREESLLLAAHLASATVDALPGRATPIPLDYDDGRYRALFQFAVGDAPELAAVADEARRWDLGITRSFNATVEQKVSARIDLSRSAGPVVLETEWAFPPGRSSIVAVGREQRLGQLVTARGQTDWPDPDPTRATIGPIAVLQERDGVFLRKDGDTEQPVRRRGLLALGDEEADAAQAIRLVGLACRGKREKRDLWVHRRWVSETPRELEPLALSADGRRCVRLSDVAEPGSLGPGAHAYEVTIRDSPVPGDEPIATRAREFRVREAPSPETSAETTLAAAEPAAAAPPAEPPPDLDEAVPEIVREPIGPFIEPVEKLPPLDTILARMARVASLYLGHALSFTADERTEVFTYFRGLERDYLGPESVYCYINSGHGVLDDRRVEKRQMTKLKRRLANGEDVSAELMRSEDPLRNNTTIPVYVVRPYTWIVLFSREAQQVYRYRIAGATKRGVWLSFEPARANPDPSDWYGDVLVDLETFQIILAQGFQHESIEEVRKARAMIENEGDVPADEIERTFVEMHTTAEFKREAHGIRLPSKVETKIYHHLVVQPVARKYDKRLLTYKVVQTFKNYEFFGVEVRDQIVSATSPPPDSAERASGSR